MQLRVTQMSAAEVLGVRREVLRPGLPPGSEGFPEDDRPDTVHMAAVSVESGEVVAVATFFPAPFEGVPAWQLRGMAVLGGLQGTGVGATLLRGSVDRLRELGATRVWAHARDTALGFYERQGWKVVGDGYEYGPMKLAHHTAVLELAD